jgi:hypothetical protein
MKKGFVLMLLLMMFFLKACVSYSDRNFIIISEDKVDGYDIYEYQHSILLCKNYYEEVYYSGETYNYGFSFYACSHDLTFFIKKDGEYIDLHDAIDQKIISIESLIPELEKFKREPEIISTKKADYYWLDFHINNRVVYAYAGGACEEHHEEIFLINGESYQYSASGCLKEHILFMKIDESYRPINELLDEGLIEGKYLVPLLDSID